MKYLAILPILALLLGCAERKAVQNMELSYAPGSRCGSL